MEKNIIVQLHLQELHQQIHLRNYYLGEAAKRQTINADLLQSSDDDSELMKMFIDRASLEIAHSVAMRIPEIKYENNGEYITFHLGNIDEKRNYIIPMLTQAITDYLVNEACLQWLLLRQPSMAESYISLRPSLYSQVQQALAKLYNSKKTRRRATELAGI